MVVREAEEINTYAGRVPYILLMAACSIRIFPWKYMLYIEHRPHPHPIDPTTFSPSH